MHRSHARQKSFAIRLFRQFDRLERGLKIVLACLLLLLLLFQFMPFSPEIRTFVSDADRLEGRPMEP